MVVGTPTKKLFEYDYGYSANKKSSMRKVKHGENQFGLGGKVDNSRQI